MTAAGTRAPIAGYEHVFHEGTSGWTLLLLHGTGGDEHDLVPLGQQLLPGAAILSPRGTVLENGVTNRFFARRTPTDIDVDDMLHRSDELDAFLAEAAEAYGIDRSRTIALGFSNGANIALASLLRHAGWARGAVLLRPAIYHVPEDLPDLSATDVLVAAGAHDPFSPPQTVELMRSVLERAGAGLEVVVEPNAGHGLVPDDLMRVGTWLERVTGTA